MADMAEPREVVDAVEDAASEQLGVNHYDRPAIYRECTEAATENRVPYWSVLMLSGAIATLGLALNSSAVVIGAMLVAPLLAPVVGLALALAVGDGRLSVQTAAVVLGSTAAVIGVAALLTVLLPFHTITLEISARTRPTTLDLAIAVFSGLVGAVVMVARKSRLSAAIPGVAISVALIPPLAVTGFGIGIGHGSLIRGSLLLYGANLAGIVLSGMGVFLLVGMHRPEVVEAARDWHRSAKPHGLTAWTDRVHWIRTLGVFRSPWARIGLVLAFAVAVGLPLSETLSQIARETRVDRAVVGAERQLFDVPGRASILGKQVILGAAGARVYLRVATTEWFRSDDREEFERIASAAAGEPVRLTLEQLPARGDDLDQLRALFQGQDTRAAAAAPPASLEDLLVSARARLNEALEGVALPASVAVLRKSIATAAAGGVTVGLDYAAAEPLNGQAEEMLRAQVQRALALPEFRLQLRHVSLALRPLAADNDLTVDEIGELLRDYDDLYVEVLYPFAGPDAAGELARDRLRSAGIPDDRITLVRDAAAGVQARIRVRPREQGSPRLRE
jgi:uncharacterized hydrophobic protein (TIGR00271 family)